MSGSDIISIAVMAFAAAQAWSTLCVWVAATSRRCAVYLAASVMVVVSETTLWPGPAGRLFAESSSVGWFVHCAGTALLVFVAADRNRRFRRSGDAVFIRPPAARAKGLPRADSAGDRVQNTRSSQDHR